MDKEIYDMQTEWLDRNRETSRWMIVRELDGWSVHLHTIAGVAPVTTYPTKEQAAARLLQSLDIDKPVKPQDWPESVGIGRIVEANDEQ